MRSSTFLGAIESVGPARGCWLIALFSLLVHLPGITSPLLDHHAFRQTQTASVAANYARYGMNFGQPRLSALEQMPAPPAAVPDASSRFSEGRPARAGGEFPVYSYLLALLYASVGVHDMLGRLLSALFAAAGAIYLFLFVRELLPQRLAIASALVMCILPVHVYFTRTVQPESMALWAMLGFLFHWDRWVNRGARRGDLVVACLLGAMSCMLKLPYLIPIALLGPAVAWDRWRWRVAIAPSSWALAASVLCGTGAWYAYARTAPVATLPLDVGIGRFFEPLTTWWYYYDLVRSRLPGDCTTYAGLVLGLLGAWRLWRASEARESQTILFGWALAAGVSIVLLGGYGWVHEYAMLPVAPVSAVFIAMGIDFAWSRTAASRLGRTLLVLLLVSVPIESYRTVHPWYEIHDDYLLRARKVVAELTEPDALFLTNTRDVPVVLYHLGRCGYALDLEREGLASLDGYPRLGVRYFLTPTAGPWSRHPEWAEHLARRGQALHRDPEFLLYRLDPESS